MQHYKTRHYIDALPALVENYNNSVHSVTKKKPAELHALGDSNPREAKPYERSDLAEAEFAEAKASIKKQASKWLHETAELPLKDNIVQGDYVRLAEGQKVEVKRNALFRKFYARKWSEEIYKVAYVNVAQRTTQLNTYTLMDPEIGEIFPTQYFGQDLQRVDIKNLKKFEGKRPDFSMGQVFDRERFLQEDLPAIREVLEPVQSEKPQAICSFCFI